MDVLSIVHQIDRKPRFSPPPPIAASLLATAEVEVMRICFFKKINYFLKYSGSLDNPLNYILVQFTLKISLPDFVSLPSEHSAKPRKLAKVLLIATLGKPHTTKISLSGGFYGALGKIVHRALKKYLTKLKFKTPKKYWRGPNHPIPIIKSLILRVTSTQNMAGGIRIPNLSLAHNLLYHCTTLSFMSIPRLDSSYI